MATPRRSDHSSISPALLIYHSALGFKHEFNRSLQHSNVIIRVLLANGRRAEIDLASVDQLEAIIGALERRP
jgi:hypothetical protein